MRGHLVGALSAPCYAPNYHLYPVLSGAARQRGKMVLGLTLLGLSFAPGVSAGMSSLGTMATGSASFGQGLASLGTQLMARTGQFMMSQGAMQSISPPQYQPTDEIRSSRIGVRAAATEGHDTAYLWASACPSASIYRNRIAD